MRTAVAVLSLAFVATPVIAVPGSVYVPVIGVPKCIAQVREDPRDETGAFMRAAEDGCPGVS